MTQKEKLVEAKIFAHRVKSWANTLERDSKDFDVRFPLSTAKEMKEAADVLLKTLQ